MGKFHIETYRRLKEILGDDPKGWWGDRIDVRFELLRIVAKIHSGRTLDVGCGPGLVLQSIGGGTRVGLDISGDYLRRAREAVPEALFIRGDMNRLPFPERSFDEVILSGVMIRDPDMKDYIPDAARVLKPGGKIYICSPNPRFFQYRARSAVLMSLGEVLADLDRLGFRILKASGYNPLVFFTLGRGGRVLSFLPGIEHLLSALTRLPWRIARRLCVSYLVVAVKT